MGSIWLTNFQEKELTKLKTSSFSPVETTNDVLSLSMMMQENHYEILEQQTRLDFLSSNLNIFIATYNLNGNTEYQNSNFRAFKKSFNDDKFDILKLSGEHLNSSDLKSSIIKFTTPDKKIIEFHIKLVDKKILLVGSDIKERDQL